MSETGKQVLSWMITVGIFGFAGLAYTVYVLFSEVCSLRDDLNRLSGHFYEHQHGDPKSTADENNDTKESK